MNQPKQPSFTDSIVQLKNDQEAFSLHSTRLHETFTQFCAGFVSGLEDVKQAIEKEKIAGVRLDYAETPFEVTISTPSFDNLRLLSPNEINYADTTLASVSRRLYLFDGDHLDAPPMIAFELIQNDHECLFKWIYQTDMPDQVFRLTDVKEGGTTMAHFLLGELLASRRIWGNAADYTCIEVLESINTGRRLGFVSKR